MYYKRADTTFSVYKIVSRMLVTIRRRFGSDVWIYCTYTLNSLTTSNAALLLISTICKLLFTAGLSTLKWTAPNNSDASIHFLCSQGHILAGWRLATRLNSFSLLPSSYLGRLASRNSTDSSDPLCPFYNPSARTAQKTQHFHSCVNSPRKRA
jgi:hypothetical protein